MADNDERLEKLLSILSQQSGVLGLDIGKHSEEAVELKKQFFINVTTTIESINKLIDSHSLAIADLQKHLYSIQLNFKTELSALKDFMIKEIKELREYHDEDFDKYTEKIEVKLNKIVDKLDSIPETISDFKNTQTQDSLQFKNALIKDEIRPLGDKVTNIYIKVMVLSSVAGIIGSVLFSLFLTLVRR